MTGHCGSVLVRLIPAPRGTGIVSVPMPKKLLMMAGIDHCYTSARGCTTTLGNFTKVAFDAISKTYSYLTSDFWKETVFTKSPYQEFTDHPTEMLPLIVIEAELSVGADTCPIRGYEGIFDEDGIFFMGHYTGRINYHRAWVQGLKGLTLRQLLALMRVKPCRLWKRRYLQCSEGQTGNPDDLLGKSLKLLLIALKCILVQLQILHECHHFTSVVIHKCSFDDNEDNDPLLTTFKSKPPQVAGRWCQFIEPERAIFMMHLNITLSHPQSLKSPNLFAHDFVLGTIFTPVFSALSSPGSTVTDPITRFKVRSEKQRTYLDFRFVVNFTCTIDKECLAPCTVQFRFDECEQPQRDITQKGYEKKRSKLLSPYIPQTQGLQKKINNVTGKMGKYGREHKVEENTIGSRLLYIPSWARFPHYFSPGPLPAALLGLLTVVMKLCTSYSKYRNLYFWAPAQTSAPSKYHRSRSGGARDERYRSADNKRISKEPQRGFSILYVQADHIEKKGFSQLIQ
eukprot:bmy_07773T0